LNFNSRFGKARYLGLLLLVIVLFAGSQSAIAETPASSLLVSVAFKTNNPFGNSPPMSGSEPAAAIANPLFEAANVWNNLHVEWAPPLTTNPIWNNLVDSTGQTTGVSLSITGTVLPVDFWPWLPNPDPLRSGLIAWNSWTNGGGGGGAGESTSIVWKLTGLPPRAKFDLCMYGAITDKDRSFTMTAGGITLNVPVFNGNISTPQTCILFSDIASNTKGVITVVADGVGDSTTADNEANWSGFQIVQLGTPGKPRRLGFWRAPR
jgi:hypothetical protein